MDNIFCEYSEDTKRFAHTILNFLKDKYGEIPEIFRHSIHVLLTNYDIWLEAREDVLKRGALITDSSGEIKKNPAFKILCDTQIYINNQIKSWGLDPRSLKQLDNIQANENKQEDLLNVLNNLNE